MTSAVDSPGAPPAAASFQFRCRVYYEDTDAGGIVYYANYLKFMERARTEWLGHLGLEIVDLVEREGLLFAVRSVNMRYSRPARLNDRIVVTVEPTRIGGASLDLDQHIYRDGELLTRGWVQLACLDTVTYKPRALPSSVHAKLNAWKMP